jgi:bacillithiol biosynthesis cysteine-adding enzyme BshC
MDWIDYRQLPPAAGGYSDLFFDYVYAFDAVRRYYAYDFRDTHVWEQALAAAAEAPRERSLLTTVLREQNSAWGASRRSMETLELLEQPNAVAVVTGQQVGLFGGPLYTVFKAITAVKLAERLSSRFPAFLFVPVFWVEGEDHDFPEMHHTSVLTADAALTRIEYLPAAGIPERNPGPVGDMAFESTLEQAFHTLEGALQKTEFTGPLLAQLRTAYAPGATFTAAFARWMHLLFEDQGLVLLSAQDARLKGLLSPLFQREIAEFPRTSQLVIARSAELEEKYHAQVKPRSVNLFLLHKGGRYAIEPRENDFSLRGTRHFLSREELMRIAAEQPEILSPNVVLRPLAQDMLLPTVAYVAGPSEIAYHAQVLPLYERFGVTPPVLYPRASGSFVEERVQRTMEKYGLEVAAFFDDIEKLKAVVLEEIEEVKLERLFQDAGRSVGDALNELRFAIMEVDGTLEGPADAVRAKVEQNLAVLKEKAVAAQQRRHESAMRQIDRSVACLLPGGSLEERELSMLYYMNRYGPELVRWLMAEMDVTGFKHQLLML